MKIFLHRFFVLWIFPATSLAQPCSDLFISEYVEGSSFNKVIEIYNPTTGTILLDGYQLLLYSNGATVPSFNFKLHGPLESHGVYLVSHPQADSLLVLPFVDTTGLVCNWNGDDAIALVNNNTGDTLDILGEIGIDPGASWTVPGGSTVDHSLVRIIDTQEGTIDWLTGSEQWVSFDQNDFSHLGTHTILDCPAANPEISIVSDSTSIPENAGSFQLKISILNPNTGATSGDVKVTGGTATQGSDYLFTDQTITFPANAFEPIILPVEIVSDGFSEPDESIEISLQNPTNGATIGAAVVVVKIIDDDGLDNSEPDLVNLQVFPNPVFDRLYITTALPVNSIAIENLLGETLLGIQHSGTGRIELNIKEFVPGIYFLKVNVGENNLTRKILKY